MHSQRSSALPAAILLLALGATGALSAQYRPGISCMILGPGYSSCAGYVDFSSYAPSPVFQPFQAQSGNGYQGTVNVYFSPPVYQLRFRVNDPDFDDNLVYWFRQNIGRAGLWVAQGDRAPGVFTVEGANLGAPPSGTYYTRLELVSDGADYVNWYVQFRPFANGPWCNIIQHRNGSCFTNVTVTPFWAGSDFDPFQAVAGTGAQPPLEIAFDYPLYSVSVHAVDADYAGNRMEAYGLDDTLLATVYFDGDGVPGFPTWNKKTITDARGIKRIKLISDPNDYVAFQGLTATMGY